MYANWCMRVDVCELLYTEYMQINVSKLNILLEGHFVKSQFSFMDMLGDQCHHRKINA